MGRAGRACPSRCRSASARVFVQDGERPAVRLSTMVVKACVRLSTSPNFSSELGRNLRFRLASLALAFEPICSLRRGEVRRRLETTRRASRHSVAAPVRAAMFAGQGRHGARRRVAKIHGHHEFSWADSSCRPHARFGGGHATSAAGTAACASAWRCDAVRPCSSASGTVMRDSSSDATSPAISEMASPWKIGSGQHHRRRRHDHGGRGQGHRPEPHRAGVDHGLLERHAHPCHDAVR